MATSSRIFAARFSGVFAWCTRYTTAYLFAESSASKRARAAGSASRAALRSSSAAACDWGAYAAAQRPSRWQTGLLPVHRAAVAAEALFDLKADEEGRPPMSSAVIASIVFGCSFGAALIGMVLHVKLPDHHLDGDSRDVVKLVMGLIATMAALVLSLLIASANSSYDRQSSELKTLSTTSFCLTGH